MNASRPKLNGIGRLMVDVLVDMFPYYEIRVQSVLETACGFYVKMGFVPNQPINMRMEPQYTKLGCEDSDNQNARKLMVERGVAYDMLSTLERSGTDNGPANTQSNQLFDVRSRNLIDDARSKHIEELHERINRKRRRV